MRATSHAAHHVPRWCAGYHVPRCTSHATCRTVLSHGKRLAGASHAGVIRCTRSIAPVNGCGGASSPCDAYGESRTGRGRAVAAGQPPQRGAWAVQRSAAHRSYAFASRRPNRAQMSRRLPHATLSCIAPLRPRVTLTLVGHGSQQCAAARQFSFTPPRHAARAAPQRSTRARWLASCRWRPQGLTNGWPTGTSKYFFTRTHALAYAHRTLARC
jgi:hypothetical protein